MTDTEQQKNLRKAVLKGMDVVLDNNRNIDTDWLRQRSFEIADAMMAATDKPDDKSAGVPLSPAHLINILEKRDAEIARLTTELENEGQVHAMFDQQQPEIDRLNKVRRLMGERMNDKDAEIAQLKWWIKEGNQTKDTEIKRLVAERGQLKAANATALEALQATHAALSTWGHFIPAVAAAIALLEAP